MYVQLEVSVVIRTGLHHSNTIRDYRYWLHLYIEPTETTRGPRNQMRARVYRVVEGGSAASEDNLHGRGRQSANYYADAPGFRLAVLFSLALPFDFLSLSLSCSRAHVLHSPFHAISTFVCPLFSWPFFRATRARFAFRYFFTDAFGERTNSLFFWGAGRRGGRFAGVCKTIRGIPYKRFFVSLMSMTFNVTLMSENDSDGIFGFKGKVVVI